MGTNTKNRGRRKRKRPVAQVRGATRRRPRRPLIGLIGAGNMARSLAGGLLENGWARNRIILSDLNGSQRQAIERTLGLATYGRNEDVVARADVLVFAVKPQALRTVALEVATAVQRQQPLVISIAAGVRLADLERWLGGTLPVVRAMPNTPALIGSGATGLYANKRVTEKMRDVAESLMRAVGVTVWLTDELLLDVITALSGSGPAYFFLVMEALEQAAVAHGLPPATARLFTLETAFGAAKMALEASDEPTTLRARVTSPGGTTEAAVAVLQEGGLPRLLHEALATATRRARELGEILGRDV